MLLFSKSSQQSLDWFISDTLSQIQSEVARALDSNKFSIMASLDLSSAFDIVNVDILFKRLLIVGLPNDPINLIRIWLNDITYYVSAKGHNSYIRL